MILWISPLALMLICWALTGLVAGISILWIDDLDLVALFMAREDLTLDVLSLMGVTWLIAGGFAYWLGDLLGRTATPHSRSFHPGLCLNRAARLTFALNGLLLAVTLVWIISTAGRLGGLQKLIELAYLETLTTRDLLLENKLFVGMRLFYAALPSMGCLAAALLAAPGLDRKGRTLCFITLGLNAVALLVLPIVMSQRLLLLQFLLSAYLAACLVRQRLLGLHWLGLGVLLFLTLWVAREALTNPSFDRSATDIAFQKLAFYVVNDMWNSLAPLSQPIPHTYGKLTFEGMMFLTLTDGYFLTLLDPKMEQLDAVLGGGEFPFFTSAYVDFGLIGGAVVITAMAAIFRVAFHLARQTLGWAAIYSQIGAALLFSSHSVYVTHQNFLFSIALISLVARASRWGAESTTQYVGPARYEAG